jgi:hypothetical protein
VLDPGLVRIMVDADVDLLESGRPDPSSSTAVRVTEGAGSAATASSGRTSASAGPAPSRTPHESVLARTSGSQNAVVAFLLGSTRLAINVFVADHGHVLAVVALCGVAPASRLLRRTAVA